MKPLRRFQVLPDAPDLLVLGRVKIALVVEVDQFAALIVIEEESAGVEKLQRIVLGGIVGRGQSDAATGPGGSGIHLDSRSRQHAQVEYLAARRQQSALHR